MFDGLPQYPNLDERAARKAREEADAAAWHASAPEFKPWPKISRLNRDVVITEKLDGTNSAIIITDDGRVYAQSRTRILSPWHDNFGFRHWVEQNAEALKYALGPGTHFGEWWGEGIQRGYGVDYKQFSLFNTHKWVVREPGQPDRLTTELAEIRKNGVRIDVVPILYRGPLMNTVGYLDNKESFKFQYVPSFLVEWLRKDGSVAVPGYMKPEGIVVFHTAASQMFKYTLEKDEKHKGEQ